MIYLNHLRRLLPTPLRFGDHVDSLAMTEKVGRGASSTPPIMTNKSYYRSPIN